MSAGGDSARSSRRRRSLQAEERALWDHVTRSIRPMRPEPPLKAPPAESNPPEPEATAPPEKKSPSPGPSIAAKLPPRAPSPPPLAPIEPKLRRRLSRGASVDARLDLHGLTQHAAHMRLNAFLRGAQGAGHAVVLVITGKGSGGYAVIGDGERGVLRRLVPQWLAAPDLRGIVIGFETASRGHGGEGALYVRLRRVRDERR